MLVLVRNMGESIVVGDDIVFTVLLVDRNQVRVGTEAPRSIAIDRAEIRQKKQAESST